MRITVVNDSTMVHQFNVGTPEDPDKTQPGNKVRTITIDCDDEAGDKIMEFVRTLL